MAKKYILFNTLLMKSLIRKETKETNRKKKPEAQCCAKNTVAQAGCHD